MRVRLAGWSGLVSCVVASSLLAAVLSLTTTVLLLPGAGPVGAIAGYGDVDGDRYYTEAVQWAVDTAVTDIAGNCFDPAAPVSRGETAVIFWNMEGQPDALAHSFNDIRVQARNDAVSWMAAAGITTGTSPTTFSPTATLTRGQLAAFLYRLAGRPAAEPHSFVDVVKGWQQAPVSWLSTSGITTGTSPSTFSPDDTLTRAEAITFLYRYQGEPDVTVDTHTPACDPASFDTIAAGGLHSCGVRTDDAVACWGDNYWGQTHAPATPLRAVTAGASHSCGVRTDDTIACWGNNHRGQSDAPNTTFQTVTAGASHSCGLRTNDTIACWGDDEHGETDAPAGTFLTVVAGASHTCGLRTDDTVACWGSNSHGQTNAPTGSFQDVATSYEHSCAIRIDDTIACWGWNSHGQTDAPTGGFQNVTTGTSHSCGLRTDDTVTCWGWNIYGQTQAPTGTFRNVTSGAFHSCAIRDNDTVTCWGWNFSGQTDSPTAAR